MAAAPKSTHVGGAEGPTDAAGIVKDLIITALLALAIFGPFVGLKTVTASGTLALQQRWGEVAVFVAITVAGRLCIHLYQMMKPKAAAAAPAKAASAKPEFAIGKYLGPIMLVIAIALPFIASTTGDRERQIMDLAILIMTYIMLGWGLNIVVGLAGLLDLGYVAFYAVGAYTYALLATIYFPMWFGEGIIPWAFFITLPIAGILAALWGVILGFPVLRLRGDYLAIVTLAFGEIIRVVLLNWVDFTGGPAGIGQIPRPSFFGLPFTADEGGFAAFFGLEHKPIYRIIWLYYIILVLALLTNFVTLRLRKLPVG
ncbi:MAG: ABC transporter permease subunit, partial [Aestuariivirga sp.]